MDTDWMAQTDASLRLDLDMILGPVLKYPLCTDVTLSLKMYHPNPGWRLRRRDGSVTAGSGSVFRPRGWQILSRSPCSPEKLPKAP
ncbi:hypothetical protein INR49_022040 [Caranx melampygus]|nr:hypothetical protein INR49_022040 [Caranx melampygus]